MQVTIFHNPRCTKSRRTLELLRERGVELAQGKAAVGRPPKTVLAIL